MVISVDAGVAEGAVAAPWSPYDLAVGAQATSLHRVEQLHEVHVFVLFECAWVTLPDKDAEKASVVEKEKTPENTTMREKTPEKVTVKEFKNIDS